jgi:peptidylprolyl isomerase
VSPARPVRRLRAAAVALALTAALSGCRVPTGQVSGGDAEPTTSHDLAAVTVSVSEGAEPVIDVPAPFSVDATQARVIGDGDGATVSLGQQVTLRYAAVNGTDGQRLLDKTWAGEPTTVIVGAKGNIPGLDEGLRGLRVGATALIAVPPDAGYGVQGNASLGVGPTDTIVCLVKVLQARTLLAKATGAAVAPKKGLPTVKRAASGRPTVTLPKEAAPTGLVVQPLIRGTGRTVAKGDRVTVQYVGVVWPGGRVFDSSWGKDEPARFSIGTNATIAGWDSIIGQKVGSQVLLVVPPDKAYGIEGRDEFGIKGTDTLVFVVDILDAEAAS